MPCHTNLYHVADKLNNINISYNRTEHKCYFRLVQSTSSLHTFTRYIIIINISHDNDTIIYKLKQIYENMRLENRRKFKSIKDSIIQLNNTK